MELCYIDVDKLMAVDVSDDEIPNLSSPRVLFQRPMINYTTGVFPREYDVAPDGERFLMVEPEATERVSEIRIVTNWFHELNQLVPTSN